MAARSNLVNLDALIKRADLGLKIQDNSSFETLNSIPARELKSGNGIAALLRKPDFQRETNHWGPEQVVSLLECYINGDLIPSVILWRSSTNLFVIDGGHRLSALRAWVEDDYGDGHISHQLFGHDIPREQRRAADRTRKLVKDRVGSWEYYQKLLADDASLTEEQQRRISVLTSRGISVQWVVGDVDKAETSFFNINMKGTPLDAIEEMLLKNRKKSIPIATRAIIRAGKGHRYWSEFDQGIAQQLEEKSAKLHRLLFEPEVDRPIKTLDLPLGGSRGVRTAIQVLKDFLLITDCNQNGVLKKIEDYPDDVSGTDTLRILSKATTLSNRITGNGDGSLGLHPAIYFYGPTGIHSTPMFLGTVLLVAKQLSNNNGQFFKDFITIRSRLERIMIEFKDLIAMIVQKPGSNVRVTRYCDFLNAVIKSLKQGENIDESKLIELAELEGRILSGDFKRTSAKISDEQKSKVFIDVALRNALKCPICQGYLDTEKSVSYDHIVRVREGGDGNSDNVQLTHPYCNQSVKC
ncbi:MULTISPECIES: GmrSD restriction endonuclease domain-containing protein [Enterobacter cloacae complex]|uniref:GmrSD restriction endonuclease domain-containing protein n=1 Tax=Enterobacter cloacae complex TaxID=354276 RepID=UPI001A166C3F|nr:DUF262 domain-containing protein [Enterobacter cloacae]EGQ5290512.1 DUF262 domain-containing protein [Enterobacter hormaechei]MCK4229014.1 DUF262 domain-containing protein [Enterobacter asburiae]MDX7665480.1 DUF262 domain-containing protein [Enterobacter cloacae]